VINAAQHRTEAAPKQIFSPEQVERARRYRRPLYVAFAASTAIEVAALAVLAFTRAGDELSDALDGLPAGVHAFVLAAICSVVVGLLRLPLSFWSGYLREHEWGFSTQSWRSFLADWAKGVAVASGLAGLFVLALVGSARLAHGAWVTVAASVAALLVLILSFLAPVLFEPLFNRFEPLRDEELARRLTELAEHAGAPIAGVLVSDASRRTRKVNAYVSGLGRSRRVVLYDTLLTSSSPAGIGVVVAHELGHRRHRHVAIGTALGMAGAAAAVVVLWALLSWDAVLDAIGATGAGDPRVAPFLLLVAVLLELLGLPFASALSRRMERTADRFSLEVTHDLPAFEEVHRELAVANLGDLDPPKVVYALLFSHPTATERIEAGRRQVAAAVG
jgi:STE24 endopeptidase